MKLIDTIAVQRSRRIGLFNRATLTVPHPVLGVEMSMVLEWARTPTADERCHPDLLGLCFEVGDEIVRLARAKGLESYLLPGDPEGVALPRHP